MFLQNHIWRLPWPVATRGTRNGGAKYPACELAGLSVEEAAEFAAIDALPPLDEAGNIAWIFQGSPTTAREKRWLALYKRQKGMRTRTNVTLCPEQESLVIQGEKRRADAN
jgi:hypothetical protein